MPVALASVCASLTPCEKRQTRTATGWPSRSSTGRRWKWADGSDSVTVSAPAPPAPPVLPAQAPAPASRSPASRSPASRSPPPAAPTSSGGASRRMRPGRAGPRRVAPPREAEAQAERASVAPHASLSILFSWPVVERSDSQPSRRPTAARWRSRAGSVASAARSARRSPDDRAERLADADVLALHARELEPLAPLLQVAVGRVALGGAVELLTDAMDLVPHLRQPTRAELARVRRRRAARHPP